MKGQTLTDKVKTLVMVQQLLGVMLVAILRHILMILVVIKYRNTFGKYGVSIKCIIGMFVVGLIFKWPSLSNG